MSFPKIADMIQGMSRDIVSAWIEVVRADPRIHSEDDLTDEGLRNHIPYIIEEICQILRAGEQPQAANTREGRVHVYTRYHQGYRARDLVIEISLLRLLLLDNLTEGLVNKRVKGGLRICAEVARIINTYLDEELRYAISVYTEVEQKGHSPIDSER